VDPGKTGAFVKIIINDAKIKDVDYSPNLNAVSLRRKPLKFPPWGI
jgi:hypothetical protein